MEFCVLHFIVFEDYCVILLGFGILRYKTYKSFSHPEIPLYAVREMFPQGRRQQCPFVIGSPRSFMRLSEVLRIAS